MDLTAFCNCPELKPGIIIYFKDKAGKTRTEVVKDDHCKCKEYHWILG